MVKILIIDDDTMLQEALNTKLKYNQSATIKTNKNHSVAQFNFMPLVVQVYFFFDPIEALNTIKQESITNVAKRDFCLSYDLILVDLKFDVYDSNTSNPLKTSGYKMLQEYNNLIEKVFYLAKNPEVDIITSMPLAKDDIIQMKGECTRIQLKNTQDKDSEVILKRIFEFLDTQKNSK